MTQEFTVSEAGERLDAFLATCFPGISRSQLQRWVEAGEVLLNGKPAKSSTKLREGDTLSVTPPPVQASDILPQDIPLDIVYEDEDLLVINKPKGMVVHPALGNPDGTLVNALLAHGTTLSAVGGVARPGIVHRLDKDTTGLLVVAKNDTAHAGLQAQIKARTMKRRYQALIWGHPPFTEAVIDAPMGRHPSDRVRMAVDTSGSESARHAVTEVTVLERLAQGIALVECRLQTGRTHQIRVHLQYAGYPVVGDPLYGGVRPSLSQLSSQALHAYRLSFTHPRTEVPLDFTAPLPVEMQELCDFLRG